MKKLSFFLSLLILSQTGFATESPISLTASDGTGTSLDLRKFEARVVLDGFLAFTELKMVFYNSENRQREGRFQIVLPDNAAISRFAMKIGERLQEGEVVEKQLARRAYEDFLHRSQDPALLETDSGNRFNARIFPIEAKSEKLLILSYSQRLDGLDNEYVLPLKGLPLLKELSIKVFYDSDSFSTTQLDELTATMSKREVVTIEKSNYLPSVDFRMPYRAGTSDLMQSEQLVAARIIPFTEATTAKQGFDNLIILIDTSASQAPYLSDSLERLETLLPQLKVGTLQVYNFDQNVKKVGAADNLTAQIALIGRVKQYKALGASRLDAAIAALKKLTLKKSRLLLISDAVVTAGETSAATLAAQLKTIDWLERVDILIPSYHSDKKIARSLAKAGKSPGIALTLNDKLISKLFAPVYANMPIKVSGSTWFWPETVDALQTNDSLIVFAELSPKHSLSNGGTISVGDKNLSLTTAKSANPILLKREWVRARIDKLLDMEDKTLDQDKRSAFHNEIINLSVKERVLSPYTSLLVLETEDDYRRYHIDRKGLADILTIGVDGLTVIKRAAASPPPPSVALRNPAASMPVPVPMSSAYREEDILEEEMPVSESRVEMMIAPSDAPDDISVGSARTRSSYSARRSRTSRRAARAAAQARIRRERVSSGFSELSAEPEKKPQISPLIGNYAKFRALLDKADIKAAGDFAQKWRKDDLGNLMALIALGEWYEKTGNSAQAARAYGSLIDYFPARADIRRWASQRLLSLKTEKWLSIDSLKKAVTQRPDHPSGHYLLAMAYWEAGQYKDAVETLDSAIKRDYPRFKAAKRMLTETLALMLTGLEQRQQSLIGDKTFKWEKVTQSQLRLVLMWETDANDVDFHIYDNQQHHAFYSQKDLPSGGKLYADITTGYGPECFTISDAKAFPYKVQAHYYNMGPMGYGMGVLHVLKYNPKTLFNSEFRPFVVMKNHAFVELGLVNH